MKAILVLALLGLALPAFGYSVHFVQPAKTVESIDWGETYNIVWEGVPGDMDVRLILFRGEEKVGQIVGNWNSGSHGSSYAWKAGRHERGMASPGPDYRIRLRVGEDTVDYTSHPFYLSRLEAPGKGETWYIGTTHEILWKIPGERVDIQFRPKWPCTGRGESLGISLYNIGRLVWRVPDDCELKNYYILIQARNGRDESFGPELRSGVIFVKRRE